MNYFLREIGSLASPVFLVWSENLDGVFWYIGIILIFVVFIYWIMPEFYSQNYTQSPSPTSDNLQLGLKKFFH